MSSGALKNDAAQLAERIASDSYAGYAYAYPHKTSYRALTPPIPLADAWSGEDRSALFLYTHLPFCEMRCGFCNLFTTVRPDADFVDATLNAIRRQSQVVANAVRPERVAIAAFGGGTPSYLHTDELERLFNGLAEDWPVDWERVPTSFEISPGTVDPDKLAALKAFGVDRISMGVQSFVPADLKALGRPQKLDQVREVCGWIRDAAFPVFNLDLIYGAADQTAEGWRHSLNEAVAQGPNELYLYPLYVRELTGLARSGKRPGEHRRELYRITCDVLGEAGFEQISMRLFRRPGTTPSTAADYCCQEDGMVGLGPGARSYTQALHYSSEYAVGQAGVRQIIRAFQETRDFSVADFGVRLDLAEQQRRYLIKSLLRCDGVDPSAFESMFGVALSDTFPQLEALADGGYAAFEGQGTGRRFRLSAAGLEVSDTIGPWLYSPAVEARMEACELV